MKNLIRQYRLASLLTVFVLFAGSAFVNSWLAGLKKPDMTLIETGGETISCGHTIWPEVRLSDEIGPVFDEIFFDLKDGFSIPLSHHVCIFPPFCTGCHISARPCGCHHRYLCEIPKKRAYELPDHRMTTDYPSEAPHNVLAELFRYNGTQTLRKNTFAGLHRHTTRIPLIGGLR